MHIQHDRGVHLATSGPADEAVGNMVIPARYRSYCSSLALCANSRHSWIDVDRHTYVCRSYWIAVRCAGPCAPAVSAGSAAQLSSLSCYKEAAALILPCTCSLAVIGPYFTPPSRHFLEGRQRTTVSGWGPEKNTTLSAPDWASGDPVKVVRTATCTARRTDRPSQEAANTSTQPAVCSDAVCAQPAASLYSAPHLAPVLYRIQCPVQGKSVCVGGVGLSAVPSTGLATRCIVARHLSFVHRAIKSPIFTSSVSAGGQTATHSPLTSWISMPGAPSSPGLALQRMVKPS
jgi:hypothetical protein